MNTTKCPNCKKENKNTNIRCEFCNTKLDHNKQKDSLIKKKKQKNTTNIILIIIFAPWFILGLIFTGTGIFSNTLIDNQSKNYLETEGFLEEYNNCQENDKGRELCNAIYKYIVNDNAYKGSPNTKKNRTDFERIIKIKYNPDNPNEYIISANKNGATIAGIIILIVTSILLISVKQVIKLVSRMSQIKEYM